MRLFLSYAQEDEEIASDIARRLQEHKFDVFRWQDPERRGRRFIELIEAEINRADAFLVVLSPHCLTSIWCRREREHAMHRENDLRERDPDHMFIRVLLVANTPYASAGFLRSYDWLDLTTEESRQRQLSVLVNQLLADSGSPSAPVPPAVPGQELLLFRNREEELEKLLRGLTNPTGQHFWLIISPPQLGKSWLLDQIGTRIASPPGQPEAAATGTSRWRTALVDIREQPPDVRTNPALILAALFGSPPASPAPARIDAEVLRDMARDVIREGKPHLCLLDSADLLDQETTRVLRSSLSQIHRHLRQAGNANVWLALVVASRTEDEWRGVTPPPRFSILPLSEFKVHTVREALTDLARGMSRQFPPSELERNAERVHSLSEGLPALLARSIQWIRTEEWIDLHRLEDQDLFEELARPYMQEGLLSLESLFPSKGERLPERKGALGEAFRVLVPYRLFTQSHLRHHFDHDPRLRQALEDLEWSIEGLWHAVSATALLARPLYEPWQQIHSAIRRVLYRYYYRSDEDRAAAHQQANQFFEIWADKQDGKEQVVGLIECIWHQARMLRLVSPGTMAATLCEATAQRCEKLRPSSAYTVGELRDYAVARVTEDEELHDVVRPVPGLLDQLLRTIATPPSEASNE